MTKKVLVPLDGSMLAERALQPALDLARSRGWALEMVQAEAGREIEEYLEAKAESIRVAGIKVHCVVSPDPAVETILEQAGHQNVELVVMSSHGRSGFERLVLGSVTEKVARQCPCPVLVVRSGLPFRLDNTERILVPLDGSELSLASIPHASRLAKETGSTLVLCRIDESYFPDLAAVGPELGRDLKDYLEAVSAGLDPDIRTEHVHNFGSAARTLLRITLQHNIDLVVMSTHGRSGVQRMVLGSTAESVLRASTVPVLLVPQSANASGPES